MLIIMFKETRICEMNVKQNITKENKKKKKLSIKEEKT